MFFAFRGNNDNRGEAGLGTNNTSYESHWVGKADHLSLRTPLFQGLAGNLTGRNGDAT